MIPLTDEKKSSYRPTDRHQDPEKQGLTGDGCVLLTGLDTDPAQ